MSEDSVTVGELFRSMGEMKEAMRAGFNDINIKLDSLPERFVSKELYRSEIDALRKEIDDSHTDRRWRLSAWLGGLNFLLLAVYYLSHWHH